MRDRLWKLAASAAQGDGIRVSYEPVKGDRPVAQVEGRIIRITADRNGDPQVEVLFERKNIVFRLTDDGTLQAENHKIGDAQEVTRQERRYM